MKVYLFISKEKKLLKMYEPYTEAMSQKLDITDKLTDADVVLILGAWTMLGAQLARKSRKMGIPYIVCPLGDVSERNCKNPWLKRSLQTACYQKSMYSKADLLIATTPLEKTTWKSWRGTSTFPSSVTSVTVILLLQLR